MLNPDEWKLIDCLCEKYNGQISLEDIAVGIDACVPNATQLYEDGILLLQNERYARPLSLFVATMEEIGKVSVLCSMARIPKENQTLWKECWRNFRSHQHKSTLAFVHTYDDEARKYPELIVSTAMLQYQLSPLAERLRQVGYYVDFHSIEKRWICPTEIGHYDIEVWLKRFDPALARVQNLHKLGLYSAKALHIQRETLGPLNVDRPKRSELTQCQIQEMQAKAINAHKEFYRRLVSEGFLPVHSDLEVMGKPLSEFIIE